MSSRTLTRQSQSSHPLSRQEDTTIRSNRQSCQAFFKHKRRSKTSQPVLISFPFSASCEERVPFLSLNCLPPPAAKRKECSPLRKTKLPLQNADHLLDPVPPPALAPKLFLFISQRAIELNPTDSTSFYLLGEWCFTFAEMPWYQRKIAAAIFASPPTSTYEEALENFKKAEEITPLFYSMNILMLGKCYIKLNDKEKGMEYLKKAVEYTIKTPDDQKAHDEAEKLLKDLNA
ncbi:regulator of microtubule dynamics protein 1 [Trichonephila inaurata madagascariensis]|uniref:Regulator of microtubule dynamics protein 1 n=1 Tax=Trichonephila inaurata madagascariensis TaxID=2747483 RepID=A0A8X6WRT3_9ARAC|nr:regulator of microtubule dynamics protein 1 [Trichonephila inaurata madagascariensis]